MKHAVEQSKQDAHVARDFLPRESPAKNAAKNTAKDSRTSSAEGASGKRLNHRAYPIRMELCGESFIACSVAALSTYLLAPRSGCAFDMGDCILDAVPLGRVFLTHAHGDHARCLLRHHSLRRLMGMAPAVYHVPQETLAGFQALARAWRQLQRVREDTAEEPHFQPTAPGDVIHLHRQLAVRAFAVEHTLPSLGYTLYDVRKKLLPAYQKHSGPQLAQLRKEGVRFEEEIWTPRLSFIGDSTIQTLYSEPDVLRSQILFLELTFLLPGERSLAHKQGHTHLEDLLRFLHERPHDLQSECIVLKHFSMRYPPGRIRKILARKLPAEFMRRVHLLI